MNRLLSLVIVASLAAQAVAVEMVYQGAFRTPQGGTAPNTYAYANARLAYNPANDSLFASGHEQGTSVGEFRIPTPKKGPVSGLPIATAIQALRPLSHNTSGNLTGTVKVGGLHVHEGRLLFTKFEFYDAEGNANVSLGRYPGTLLTQKAEGLYNVQAPNQGYVAGAFATVPAEHRATLGCELLVGQWGLSIISRSSSGPAIFGFNAADIGTKSPVPAQPFVYYPLANPLSNPDQKNPLYTRADYSGGMVMVGDSVLVIGTHGNGTPFYGDGGAQDPARSSKGEHAYPYTYQVWDHKLSDILAVKSGQKQPWQVRPTVSSLDGYFYDNSAKLAGGVAYDADKGRLFIAQPGADFENRFDPYPVIHVFQVSATTPPVEPPVDPPVEPVDPAVELLERIKHLESQLSESQSANVELTQRMASLQELVNRQQAKLNNIHAESAP